MAETLDAAITTDLTHDSGSIDTATVESIGGGGGGWTNHPPVAADDKAYLPNYYPYPFLYEEAATATDASLSDPPIVTTLAIGEEGPYPYPSSVNINVLENDTDPNGDQLAVARINGDEVDVDVPVELDSGARVKLNADGSLTYIEGRDDIVIHDAALLIEQDNTLTVNSDDEQVLIVPPPNPMPVLVDSFTYTATDGLEYDEATVEVFRMVDVRAHDGMLDVLVVGPPDGLT